MRNDCIIINVLGKMEWEENVACFRCYPGIC